MTREAAVGGFGARLFRRGWPLVAVATFVGASAVPAGHAVSPEADFTYSSQIVLAANETSTLVHFRVLPGERLVLDSLWASTALPPDGAVTIELDTRGKLPEEDFSTPSLLAVAIEASDDGPTMVTEPIEAYADSNEEVSLFVSRSGPADRPLTLALMVRGKRFPLER
jgi:hypothetical protein